VWMRDFFCGWRCVDQILWIIMRACSDGILKGKSQAPKRSGIKKCAPGTQ
jgi:hypothetical protein